MSTINMHYDDVLRDQVARLQSQDETKQDDREVQQLREQVKRLQEENAELRSRLNYSEMASSSSDAVNQ